MDMMDGSPRASLSLLYVCCLGGKGVVGTEALWLQDWKDGYGGF